MANTENIEAKLCAYVDGELDAAGRAEIEQHLATNPQHRKLMEELTRTRDLLRDLHRESAPADITEALHGQLERSVLLDDSDLDQADATIRINRWPQWMAVAAILLLAVGLAAVVYFVIAPTHQPEFTLAKPEGHAIGGRLTTEPLDDLHKDLVKRLGDDAKSKDAFAEESPRATKFGVAGGGTAAKGDFDSKDSLAKETSTKNDTSGMPRIDARDLQNQLFNSGMVTTRDAKTGAETGPLFVVVSTHDPAATYQCVTDYFKDNRITWEQVPVPMPPPLNLKASQVAMASRMNNSNKVQLKAAAPASQQMAFNREPGTMEDAAKPSAESKPVPAAVEPSTQPAQPSATAAPTTTPTNLGESIAQAEQDEINKLEQEQQPTPERGRQMPIQQQAIVQQQATTAPQSEVAQQLDGTANTMYVARNMTRRQAGDLQASLTRAKIPQKSALYDNAVAKPAGGAESPGQLDNRIFPANGPTSQRASEVANDADQIIAPDQKDNVAPSMPTTQPANAIDRQTAGAVDVPATQPIVAAMPAEQKALAPSGPATTQATTMPLLGIADQSKAREEAAVAATNPTTQTTDAEERVDVVVVVQNATPALNSAPATAPTPATSPTTAPADSSGM